jgi:hypothetical protein
MLCLPQELHQLITVYLDSSSQSCYNMICKAIFISYHGRILLAEQALKDGNHNIFLFAIEFQPLLSRYYSAAVKGNLPEAITLLKENNVKQHPRLQLECVKYDRQDIFSIINTRNSGIYAKKCVAVGRSWLPRLFRAKNPENEYMLKYAIKYNNSPLMKRLITKDLKSDSILYKMLYYAKTHNYTEIFSILVEHTKDHQFPTNYLCLIDDISLFEIHRPSWRTDTFGTHSTLWFYFSFELLRHLHITTFQATLEHRNSLFPNDITKKTIAYEPGQREDITYIFQQEYRIPVILSSRLISSDHKHEPFESATHLLFLLSNYEKVAYVPKKLHGLPKEEYDLLEVVLQRTQENAYKQGRKKFGKYYPYLGRRLVMTNEDIQSYYDYCPACFLREDNLLVFFKYGGLSFLLWCVEKGIAYNMKYLYTIAIDSGQKELLIYLLERYKPTFEDFLYACRNSNPKCVHKCIEDWELKITCRRRGKYTRENILVVYTYLPDKNVLIERVKELVEYCSVSTLLFLKRNGILPCIEVSDVKEDKKQVCMWR